MKIFMPMADKIIFVSEYDKKLAGKYKFFKNGREKIIYNGIEDIVFFEKKEAIEKLKKIINFPDKELIVGTIARLEYAKGNDILIEAISKLPRNILEKCVFLIIGEGPEILNIKSQILNFGLGNAVFLLGDVPEAAKYLKAFDIFVMTSRYEGMPYALLEAMSAGLPVIVSDVGGVREAVGNTGELIGQGNVDRFVGVLSDLIIDSEKRKNFSQKAKERVKNFSVEKNLAEIKNLFTYLVG